MAPTVQMIAIDMDGTLLNSQGYISQGTLQAIREAQAKGITVAICTGRFPENVSLMFEDVGLSCPVISLNGAIIEMDNKRVHAEQMKGDTVQELCLALESAQASYYMFGDHMITTRRMGKPHHAEVKYAARLLKERGVTFEVGEEAVRSAARKALYKFYVYEDFASCGLQKAFEAVQHVKGVHFTRSSDNNFEIMPQGIDKEHGIQTLAAMLDIPLRHVMAIGDHENDETMIKAAGFGVAMGNAVPRVKEAADAVTGTNDEEGVAQAIRKYALHQTPASNA